MKVRSLAILHDTLRYLSTGRPLKSERINNDLEKLSVFPIIRSDNVIPLPVSYKNATRSDLQFESYISDMERMPCTYIQYQHEISRFVRKINDKMFSNNDDIWSSTAHQDDFRMEGDRCSTCRQRGVSTEPLPPATPQYQRILDLESAVEF